MKKLISGFLDSKWAMCLATGFVRAPSPRWALGEAIEINPRQISSFTGSVFRFAGIVLTCLWANSITALDGDDLTNSPTSSGRTLTLSEARRLAFQNNWDLLAAKSDADLAFAQKLVAREFPNPSLSLGTSKISADGRGNSTSSGNGLGQRSYDTVVAVGQLFEIGGKRSSRNASAAAGLRGAEARL